MIAVSGEQSRMILVKNCKVLAGVAAFCVVLAGCVPATGTYYRVSSPEGDVQGYCSDIGPPVALKLLRGDVFVVIHDIPDKPISAIGLQTFSIDVRIPSKTDVVKIAWNQLVATNDETGSSLPLEIRAAHGLNLPYGEGGKEELQLDSPLPGDKYNDYSFEFVFTEKVSKKFKVHFPDMWVNDVLYRGVTIEYDQDNGTFLRC
jgi:hypothetical protein